VKRCLWSLLCLILLAAAANAGHRLRMGDDWLEPPLPSGHIPYRVPARLHLPLDGVDGDGAVILQADAQPPPPVHGADEADLQAARKVRSIAAGRLLGTLILPVADPPAGIVLLLPDSLGHDPRSTPYIDQLLRVGLAAFDILEGGDDVAAIARALQSVAAEAGGAGHGFGVIGFGAGARVALRLSPVAAVQVLLYPGCEGLAATTLLGGMATLLLHGEADPANTRHHCAALAKRLADVGPVVYVSYPMAGYAWDYPAYGLTRRIILPRPDGQGSAASEPWPELAAMSASQTADFLAYRLAGAAR
jgi:dienelactone hydrolase